MKLQKIISYIISAILLFAIGIKCYQVLFSKKQNVSQDVKVCTAEEDLIFGSAEQSIYMYFSYNCAYCRRFFKEVYPLLKEKYLDPSKVQLVLKPLAAKDDYASLEALQLLVCAKQFGKFDKLHDLLLLNPAVVISSDFASLTDTILQQNQNIAECYLEHNEYAYLKKNFQDYTTYKMKGTPSFVFKNKVYRGFRDFNEIEQIFNNK